MPGLFPENRQESGVNGDRRRHRSASCRDPGPWCIGSRRRSRSHCRASTTRSASRCTRVLPTLTSRSIGDRASGRCLTRRTMGRSYWIPAGSATGKRHRLHYPRERNTLLEWRRGGESGLVAGLDFKSSGVHREVGSVGSIPMHLRHLCFQRLRPVLTLASQLPEQGRKRLHCP